MIVNLLGYAITVELEDDEVILEADAPPARIIGTRQSTSLLRGHIPAITEVIEVVDLPVEVEKGPLYLVSTEVRRQLWSRQDLLSLTEADEDAYGYGCGDVVKHFVTNFAQIVELG